MKPSAAVVLAYLRTHGSITAIEAERLGCHRLAARISDLRAEGVAIEAHLVSRDGRRWSVYRLAPTAGVQPAAFPVPALVSPLRR